jgi:hypothetical protein
MDRASRREGQRSALSANFHRVPLGMGIRWGQPASAVPRAKFELSPALDYVPLPVRGTFCGMFVALSLMVIVAVRAPVVTGANFTVRVQLVFCARLNSGNLRRGIDLGTRAGTGFLLRNGDQCTLASPRGTVCRNFHGAPGGARRRRSCRGRRYLEAVSRYDLLFFLPNHCDGGVFGG